MMKLVSRRHCFWALLFSIMLLLATVAAAQSDADVHVVPRMPSAAPHSDSPALVTHAKPLRVDVNVVLVPVTVTDSKNQPILDLAKESFHLFEGERERPIDYFFEEDAPISVGLIVDLSSSMGNKIDRVRQAADEFFNNAHPEDDYFVVAFADKPRLLANTTQSVGTIQSKLAAMKAKGNTALADAIYLGISKLRNARYRRKALVIISDGGDNASRYSLREVQRIAKESDAQIYAVDVCDALPLLFTKKIEERFGKSWLTHVTEVTGGRTIAVDNAAKIPDAAARISLELRTQYVLGYHPVRSTGTAGWHKIKVRVTQLQDDLPLQVYYRTGYMARKE